MPLVSLVSWSKKVCMNACRCAANFPPHRGEHLVADLRHFDSELPVGGIFERIRGGAGGILVRVVEPGADLAGKEKGPANTDGPDGIELVGIVENFSLQRWREVCRHGSGGRGCSGKSPQFQIPDTPTRAARALPFPLPAEHGKSFPGSDSLLCGQYHGEGRRVQEPLTRASICRPMVMALCRTRSL